MLRVASAAVLTLGLMEPAVAAADPTIEIVQTAYEREAGNGDPRHDKNLAVVSLDCASGKIAHEYLCWISFISKADPAQTLYFDVAGVADTATGWVLQSGLCRR